MIYVEPEVKEKIIKLHLQNGRTYKSLSDEFGFSRYVIGDWVMKYRKDAEANEKQAKQLADMEELRHLQAENEELKKEIDFLKKAAAFFAKESK